MSVVGIDANRILRKAEAQCYDAGASVLALEVNLTRAALNDLFMAAARAERLLREMAEAGFGDPKQADDLRVAIQRAGGAA